MNCLFWLVLLFCCGNNGRGQSGCGNSCHKHDDCEYAGRNYRSNDNCDRSDRKCEGNMRSGSMSCYDDSRRSYENADTVPGMNRSVMNGYAAYQDGCSCNE